MCVCVHVCVCVCVSVCVCVCMHVCVCESKLWIHRTARCQLPPLYLCILNSSYHGAALFFYDLVSNVRRRTNTFPIPRVTKPKLCFQWTSWHTALWSPCSSLKLRTTPADKTTVLFWPVSNPISKQRVETLVMAMKWTGASSWLLHYFAKCWLAKVAAAIVSIGSDEVERVLQTHTHAHRHTLSQTPLP